MRRSQRSRQRRWGCALGAVGLWLVPLATPGATAAEPSAVGWWWAGRPSDSFPVAFSPVPAVPEGGFYVAGDVTGASGISALRFELDPGSSPLTLTTTVADSIGSPRVDACAAGSEWEATVGGPWDERPPADCDRRRTPGTLSEDDTTVTFDLSTFDADGIVAVVLVPGEGPDGRAPTFSASFEPPDSGALTVRGAPAAFTPTGAATDEPSSGFDDGGATLPGRRGAASSFNPDAALLSSSASASDASQPASAPLVPNRAATDFPTSEGFAYPVVLVLPLVLLVGGSYLARSLTQPVAASLGPTP